MSGLRAAGLAAALSLAACSGRPREEATPAPPLPLTVEVSGCGAFRAGPVCELPEDRTVRLWVKVPEGASITLRAGGVVRAPSGVPVDGGTRLRVEVPDGATEIVVQAAHGPASASFRLALAPREGVPALDEAEALRRGGKLDEAARALDGPLADARPWVVARAAGKLARIERARGRAERAEELFREALRRDREAGRISDELLDRFALAYMFLYGGRRFAEARAVLADAAPLEAGFPDGRATAAYYRGLVAYETGDLRAALRLFRASAAAAARLGLEDHRLDVLQPLAGTLALLGRAEEAEALLREAEAALPERAGPCRRAHLLNDMGWLALRGATSTSRAPAPAAAAADPASAAERAIPLLERARALYQSGCAEPADLCNVLTNLALAELERGRPDEAQRHLEEARRASPRPGARIEVWWRIVEGRAALRRGRAHQALEVHERLGDIGASSLLPEAQFEAALGKAQALEALGRDEAARRAYAEAEARLADSALLVPLGEGRETFLGRHERSTRLAVGFLFRRAQRLPEGAARIAAIREAAAAARSGRSRLLAALAWVDRLAALRPADRAVWEGALAEYRRVRASLDAATAGDWQLAKSRLASVTAARKAEHDRVRAALEHAISSIPRAPSAPAELPEPGEGELLLVYHPMREGWVGFALTSRSAEAHALGDVDAGAAPERLSEQLFAPFHGALAAARRVRFAAFGALDRRDLHALPWQGRPLVAHVPVVYGLDLPRAPPSSPAAGEGPLALVVADPRGDLPAAHGEAERVTAALGRRGVRAALLLDRAATHGAVTEGLARPALQLFHYVGHAQLDGRDGWESGLALARGGWLTIGDVTALPSAPRRVVLSACDGARTSDDAAGEGLGLAQAFLVRGADEVVATTRPVRDELAARVAGALYDAAPGASAGSTGDLSEALRAAQLAALADPSPSDWASFRALVP